MGNKLACCGKPATDESGHSKPTKAKPLKKGKHDDHDLLGDDIVPETVDGVQSQSPYQASGDTVDLRHQFSLLEPAPPGMTLPAVAPLAVRPDGSIQPPLQSSKFATPYPDNKVTAESHFQPQSVDQFARNLAQGDAKPACWRDIYYALIGSRKLTKDDDVVRALFSWLCSLPVSQNVFATYEELEKAAKESMPYAKQALEAKRKMGKLEPDSPEVVLDDWTKSRTSYLQAFESLCRHCNIPCTAVRGLAKGVDYNVGMKLTDHIPKDDVVSSALVTTELQHAWNVAWLDGRWCLFDCMWAAQRFTANAVMRSSQIPQYAAIEHGSEMFYFKSDPAKLIMSHYPFEEEWQLLNPTVKLKDFERSVLLKPAFFTHGLGIHTHEESVIEVEHKLILKLNVPPELVAKTLFTFSLKKESRDRKLEEKNLTNFGMEEISYADSTVTFSFRFPMAGAYKLMLYARNVGEKLFSDICEYRVEVNCDENGHGREGDPELQLLEHPYPPTPQSHYGPTEMVADLDLQTIPKSLDAQHSTKDGIFEVKFTTNDSRAKLPRITARLRSHLRDSNSLMECLLIRTVEGPAPPTEQGLKRTPVGDHTPTVSMVVITAYLPEAGEYALEVYGCQADAEESKAYFLVWQFLIDSAVGYQTITPTRKSFATTTLGAKDKTWAILGLQTINYPDPLVRIAPAVSQSLDGPQSNADALQQYSGTQGASQQHELNNVEDEALSAYMDDSKRGDLKIILAKPKGAKITVMSQLVDISGDQDDDRTNYLLQEKIEDDSNAYLDKFAYLIRIPTPKHFYKLYIYAAKQDAEQEKFPLVYTYLIEAPARIGAAEQPYLGVQLGPFSGKADAQENFTVIQS